jgi:hypothetical protein
MAIHYRDSQIRPKVKNMTLSNLDQYVQTYIHKLQLNKAVSGIQNIEYEIKRSTKSQSLYIYLTLKLFGKAYTKTIRISDHYLDNERTHSDHFRGILLNTNQSLSTYKKKKLEIIIKSKIKELLKRAPLYAINRYFDHTNPNRTYTN